MDQSSFKADCNVKSEASAGSQTWDELKKENRGIEIFLDYCSPNRCLVVKFILGNIQVIRCRKLIWGYYFGLFNWLVMSLIVGNHILFQYSIIMSFACKIEIFTQDNKTNCAGLLIFRI